ncbi:hypothetical protein AB5N19_05565 [Seiridium cardinale]|uniref:Uncharacterized protein n=1 Tax=Seiridium cardinale TaxID=138064 RepID=A0ABR2XDL8_9PEZI
MVDLNELSALLAIIYEFIFPWLDGPNGSALHEGIGSDLPAAPQVSPGPYITIDRVTCTAINQHSDPFPKMLSEDGTDYDEMYVTGFYGQGGRFDDSNLARHIHIDSGIIEVNGSINLLFQLVGMAKLPQEMPA